MGTGKDEKNYSFPFDLTNGQALTAVGQTRPWAVTCPVLRLECYHLHSRANSSGKWGNVCCSANFMKQKKQICNLFWHVMTQLFCRRGTLEYLFYHPAACKLWTPAAAGQKQYFTTNPHQCNDGQQNFQFIFLKQFRSPRRGRES